MKRLFILIISFVVLFSLSGCRNNVSEHANFYYRNAEYSFGEDRSVIESETRNISGHEDDLSYLISLYLAGPSSKKLVSPFPNNTRLISAKINDGMLSIEISYVGRQLSDAEYILACACLTLTSLDFTDAERVSVTSGDNTIEMSRNDILLLDTIKATEATEETK